MHILQLILGKSVGSQADVGLLTVLPICHGRFILYVFHIISIRIIEGEGDGVKKMSVNRDRWVRTLLPVEKKEREALVPP